MRKQQTSQNNEHNQQDGEPGAHGADEITQGFHILDQFGMLCRIALGGLAQKHDLIFNVYLMRPIAGQLVALFAPTGVTPNQITLMALIAGTLGGIAFLIGTSTAMVAGGLLLWSSAILDGADGILARAKRMFSDVGRALDGATDGLVGVLTVLPAFYHLWVQQHSVLHLVLMPFAIGTTLFHVYLFDFYKEAFLQHANPGPEREANWLPAPRGPLGVTMRLYAPRPAALDGRWSPPPARKA